MSNSKFILPRNYAIYRYEESTSISETFSPIYLYNLWLSADNGSFGAVPRTFLCIREVQDWTETFVIR
jgi:hypothetical protein